MPRSSRDACRCSRTWARPPSSISEAAVFEARICPPPGVVGEPCGVVDRSADEVVGVRRVDLGNAGVDADPHLGAGRVVWRGGDRLVLVSVDNVDRPPRRPDRVGKHQEVAVARGRDDPAAGVGEARLDPLAVRPQDQADVSLVALRGVGPRHPLLERDRTHQVGEDERGWLRHRARGAEQRRLRAVRRRRHLSGSRPRGTTGAAAPAHEKRAGDACGDVAGP